MEHLTKDLEVYLDNHNFAEPASYALEALQKASNSAGSLYAPHGKGALARKQLLENSQSICDLISPSLNHDLFFYNSSSEMFFKLYTRYRMREAKWEGKNHIFFWDEAPPIFSDCLCEKIPQKEGVVDLEALARLITPKTGFIILPHADPLTGIIQPIEELYKLCNTHNILLHLDGSFSAGKIPFTLKEYPELSYSLSTNQLHTPVDAGILFFPKDRGSDLLESEIAIPLLVSANMAARHAELFMDKLSIETAHLRMHFEKALDSIGSSLCSNMFRLPTVSLMLFPKVHQEMLAYKLHKRKLFAAIQHKKTSLEESLRSFTSLEEEKFMAISFVFSRFTTQEMVDLAIKIIKEEVDKLTQTTKAFHVGTI